VEPGGDRAEPEGGDLTPVEAAHPVPNPPKKKLGRPSLLLFEQSEKRKPSLLLFEQSEKRKPPKAKVNPPLDPASTHARFVAECFDEDPGATTSKALVRARHRLWSRCTSRSTTEALCQFFAGRYSVVHEMDMTRLMKSACYKGIALKPWAPADPPPAVFQADVALFVREACEVHLMGRVTTKDLCAAFSAWKSEKDPEKKHDMSYREKARFTDHLAASFFRSMVSTTRDATCAPGFFGLYLATASDECRAAGYFKSPNTAETVVKLNSVGTVVDLIESVQAAAKAMGYSDAHVCKQLAARFADGMQGMAHGGYSYMKSSDYRKLLASRPATPNAAPAAPDPTPTAPNWAGVALPTSVDGLLRAEAAHRAYDAKVEAYTAAGQLPEAKDRLVAEFAGARALQSA
jgi:hypothetical protein